MCDIKQGSDKHTNLFVIQLFGREMNPALYAIVFAGFLICGCSAFKDPLRPIEGSDQLSNNWESASIKEHALTLTPLKIAEEAPDTYRRLIESAKPTKDADGREILTVVGGQICPEHKFILDRAAGKILIMVKLEGFESSPLTTTILRQSDGWHYSQPPLMPLNNRAEQAGD